MPRRPDPRMARQNEEYLAALRRTGNSRLSAHMLGLNRATMNKRRARDPAFAAAWDEALAAARTGANVPAAGPRLRAAGGELVLVRLKSGAAQVRRAQPGQVLPAGEQAFLRALSGSANVRLSAAAAGIPASNFYYRKRKSRPFAREMRLALDIGFAQLETALLRAGAPDSGCDDRWRANDPPPIPPMSAHQAMQLFVLRERGRCRLEDAAAFRSNESPQANAVRIRAHRAREEARAAEQAELERILTEQENRKGRRRRKPEPGIDPLGLTDPPDPAVPVEIPDLSQVTGWSKATGNPPHHPHRALFGGWRLDDWAKREKKKGEGEGD